MKTFYNSDYFSTKYVNRLVVRLKLAHIYYLWIAYFCIVKPCHLQKGDRVLDVGCGVGLMVWALRRLGIDAYGVDPSPAAAAYSLEPEYCRYEPDAMSIYSKNHFKVSTTNEVLEHLTVPQIKSLVRDMNRVTTDYIVHMVGVSDRGDLTQLEPSHITIQPEKWWKKFLTDLGYDVKVGNIFYFFPYLYSRNATFLAQKKGYFFIKL